MEVIPINRDQYSKKPSSLLSQLNNRFLWAKLGRNNFSGFESRAAELQRWILSHSLNLCHFLHTAGYFNNWRW